VDFNMSQRPTTVITFGTYDVLHVGHIRLLARARALGDRLVVGVSTDALNISKKGRPPIYPEQERMEIVRAIRYVDDVFLEYSLELKREYVIQHQADVLVMGNDWGGKFDFLNDICRVEYLERTQGISTTQIIAEIQRYG
jgi:glycerol-3-phosphate cytidylyltransferase